MERTDVEDWADPRPNWADKYPLFAAPATGDGSLAELQEAGSITVCAQTDIRPLVYVDGASDDPIGYEVDLLSAAADLLGIEDVKYVNVPFASYIPALQADQCDMLMGGLSPRSDRAGAPGVTFTYAYDHFASALVAAKGSGIDDVSELKGQRIAAVSNSLQASDAATLLDGIGGGEVLDLEDEASVELAVLNGTAQAAVVNLTGFSVSPMAEDLMTLDHQFPSDPPAEFGDEYDVNPYLWGTEAAVTPTSSGDLNVALSVAFDQLHSDGTAQAIYEEWNVYQEGTFDVVHSD